MNRKDKAREFYQHIVSVISNKKRGDQFHGGFPFAVVEAETVLGLRVCSIYINCEFDNNRLLRSLDKATLPHLVPWRCNVDPVVYQHGRFIVIEASWPPGYEREKVTLAEISSPKDRFHDRIIVGVDSFGTNITLYLHDLSHLLIAGQTGSGKSWTMRAAWYQSAVNGRVSQYVASRDPKAAKHNLIVGCDGKGGEGLGIVSGISPYQVGPLAIQEDDIVNALGWCITEMRHRYEIIRNSGGVRLPAEYPHIIVFFDEFQVFTKKSRHPLITAMMNTIATQGRAAHIHFAACTQKPLQENWGDHTTRDQFDARIAQKVSDRHASEAAIGDTFPHCHQLLPHGDAWVKAHTPKYQLARAQIAYIPESELLRLQGCQPMMDRWPVFNADEFQPASNGGGRPKQPPTPEHLAIGLEAVANGYRRPWYRKQEFQTGTPGADRTNRILDEWCAPILRILQNRGFRILEGTLP